MVGVQVASVRMVPWARANLNHTAQALIISTGFINASNIRRKALLVSVLLCI